MEFFNGVGSNPEEFAVACKKYIHSRSLAQIQQDTLEVLQQNFEDRCNELSRIQNAVPEDDAEQEEYKKKFGSLWDLFDFIDVENYKLFIMKEINLRYLFIFLQIKS